VNSRPKSGHWSATSRRWATACTASSALLGNAALLLVLGLVAMRFVPQDKRRAAWIGGGYIMLTSTLFGLLYVPFGGWFEALTSWIPGIWKKVLVLAVFIPSVVAVRRYLPRLLPFLAPKEGSNRQRPARFRALVDDCRRHRQGPLPEGGPCAGRQPRFRAGTPCG
jgi:hypothetical protein